MYFSLTKESDVIHKVKCKIVIVLFVLRSLIKVMKEINVSKS